MPGSRQSRAAERQISPGNGDVACRARIYHDRVGRFPPASQVDMKPGIRDLRQYRRECASGCDNPADPAIWKPNWMVLILGYMEETTTHDAFNLELNLGDPVNRAA